MKTRRQESSGNPARPDREAAQRQLDLFAERGGVEPRQSPQTAASSPAPAPALAVDALSDDDLLELIPNAGPSNVEAVCSEVVSRSLQAAVPALEALWRRFSGFGIEKPLREQLAVVDTLARLGGTDARSALTRSNPCWASSSELRRRRSSRRRRRCGTTTRSFISDGARAAIRASSAPCLTRCATSGARARKPSPSTWKPTPGARRTVGSDACRSPGTSSPGGAPARTPAWFDRLDGPCSRRRQERRVPGWVTRKLMPGRPRAYANASRGSMRYSLHSHSRTPAQSPFIQ